MTPDMRIAGGIAWAETNGVGLLDALSAAMIEYKKPRAAPIPSETVAGETGGDNV